MSGNPAFRLNSGPTVNIISSGSEVRDTNDSGGHLYDKNTHPWQTPVLPPELDYDASQANNLKKSRTPMCEAIHDRLRDHSVRHPSSKSRDFWPRTLFGSLISRKDVAILLDELAQTYEGILDGQTIDDATETISTRYRKILALLLLIGKGKLIRKFVSRGIDDSKLPFPLDYQFDGLIKDAYRDNIRLDYQWRLNVPFFQPLAAGLGSPNGHVCHLNISEFDIQPWDRLDAKPREAQKGAPGLLSVTLAGGYGEVHKIIIHPWQHDFHGVLEKVSFPRQKRDFFFVSNVKPFRNQLTRRLSCSCSGHLIRMCSR